MKRALFACALVFVPTFAGADDAKEQIRERFRAGMERYQAGAYREAIGYWEAIYRELGPREGYRLSFNLARAYEKFQDYTFAAERYEAFVAEVARRRSEGQELEPLVEKEAGEAESRLDELRRTKGRLDVAPAKEPLDARIDDGDRRPAGFVAYVSPGPHAVLFLRGTEVLATRAVDVDAGSLVRVEPPDLPPSAPALRTRHEVLHPFAPSILYVAGAATALSVLVPILVYRKALSIKNEHDALLRPDGTVDATQLSSARAKEDDYLATRSTAYATVAIPVALAALTGGLAAWYVLGKTTHEVVVRPEAGPTSMGASATFRY